MIKMKDMTSVSKKYPKLNENVLATDGTNWSIVYRHKSFDYYNPTLYSLEWAFSNVRNGMSIDFSLDNITHWMPLPKRRNK